MGLSCEVCWKGWLHLEGGGNWASVEGSPEEWAEVASCLTMLDDFGSRVPVSHKRIALKWEDGAAKLYSPRNAMGPGDVVAVPVEAIAGLVKSIESAIAESNSMPNAEEELA